MVLFVVIEDEETACFVYGITHVLGAVSKRGQVCYKVDVVGGSSDLCMSPFQHTHSN